jgi:aerobic-type carbon monoxide dehydrogenase small subunit (CoxS/CutS family)
MTFQFTVNGSAVSVDAPAVAPLLWVIREQLRLTGTKYGCGVGLCGAMRGAHRRQASVFVPDAGVESCRQGSDDD